VPFEIIPPGTNIDFIGRWRICAALSGSLILISILALPLRGIQWGTDFAGGSEVHVKFNAGVPADEGSIRQAIEPFEAIEQATVVRFGDADANEFLIKFGGDINQAEPGDESEPGVVSDVVVDLTNLLGKAVGPLRIQRVDFVGPRVGEELRREGFLSLFWASLAILAYITFRFNSRFAPGAIVAVLHDLMITAGIFVILGLEFDLRILAAMLAIMGYSLNDTIIIYDRIRENMERRTSYDLPMVLNESVNQTLSRTVLTSGTTLLALTALLLIGGPVIQPFAFAMLIGVVIGTYSSIYIAAPTLMFLQTRLGAPRA